MLYSRQSIIVMKASRKYSGIFLLAVILLGYFGLIYWPIVINLITSWLREPAYTHGFIVVPLSIYILWTRRSHIPTTKASGHWLGLILIGVSIALHVMAKLCTMSPLDGWSFLVWFAGVVWFVGGMEIFRWSLPAIVFMWFTVPLPYRVDYCIVLQFQEIVAKVSIRILQLFGQPVSVKAHTIILGEQCLEIDFFCLGLRNFMGIAALASAFTILFHKSWWEKLVLFFSVIPIAIMANAIKIVAVGLLYVYCSFTIAEFVSCHLADWLMIPLAVMFLIFVLWYLSKSTKEVEQLDFAALLRRHRLPCEMSLGERSCST
jgi:exosortase